MLPNEQDDSPPGFGVGVMGLAAPTPQRQDEPIRVVSDDGSDSEAEQLFFTDNESKGTPSKGMGPVLKKAGKAKVSPRPTQQSPSKSAEALAGKNKLEVMANDANHIPLEEIERGLGDLHTIIDKTVDLTEEPDYKKITSITKQNHAVFFVTSGMSLTEKDGWKLVNDDLFANRHKLTDYTKAHSLWTGAGYGAFWPEARQDTTGYLQFKESSRKPDAPDVDFTAERYTLGMVSKLKADETGKLVPEVKEMDAYTQGAKSYQTFFDACKKPSTANLMFGCGTPPADSAEKPLVSMSVCAYHINEYIMGTATEVSEDMRVYMDSMAVLLASHDCETTEEEVRVFYGRDVKKATVLIPKGRYITPLDGRSVLLTTKEVALSGDGTAAIIKKVSELMALSYLAQEQRSSDSKQAEALWARWGKTGYGGIKAGTTDYAAMWGKIVNLVTRESRKLLSGIGAWAMMTGTEPSIPGSESWQVAFRRRRNDKFKIIDTRVLFENVFGTTALRYLAMLCPDGKSTLQNAIITLAPEPSRDVIIRPWLTDLQGSVSNFAYSANVSSELNLSMLMMLLNTSLTPQILYKTLSPTDKSFVTKHLNHCIIIGYYLFRILGDKRVEFQEGNVLVTRENYTKGDPAGEDIKYGDAMGFWSADQRDSILGRDPQRWDYFAFRSANRLPTDLIQLLFNHMCLVDSKWFTARTNTLGNEILKLTKNQLTKYAKNNMKIIEGPDVSLAPAGYKAPGQGSNTAT